MFNQIAPSGLYVPPPALLINGVMRGTVGSRRAVISGGGGTGLQDDIASACYHLDATDSASYSGSGQTWSNLIASPHDGAAQTDFDMYLGTTSAATATDPTFNGSAGSSSAYFSTDASGDCFTSISTSTPGHLAKVQRTDQSVGFWMATFYKYRTGTNLRHLSNSNSTTDYGFQILQTTNGDYRFSRYRNSTVQTTTVLPNSSFSSGTIYGVILSMNAARTNFRIWKNTRTATDVAPAASWTAVTNDANNKFGFGVNIPTNSAFLPANVELYAIAGGDDYLDDTAAGLIFDFFNSKHARTYA